MIRTENFSWKSLRYRLLMVYVCSLVCKALSVATVSAQSGAPPIRSYFARDYRAEQQNLDLVQDQAGILYIGNRAGLLTYDGRYWQLHRLPDSSAIQRIALDAHQRIWTATAHDFGFWQPDTTGHLRYRSVYRPRLQRGGQPRAERSDTTAVPTGGVRQVQGFYLFGNRFLIATDDTLYEWLDKNRRLHPLPIRSDSTVASVDQAVWLPGAGLLTVVGDTAYAAPTSRWLAPCRVRRILSLPEAGKKLIATDQGLFIHDGAKPLFFSTLADYYFKRNVISDAALLPNGHWAIATERAGLVILNPRRRRIETSINQAVGLQTDEVNRIWLDREGGLWLGLQVGLARADVFSPLASYDNLGLRGGVNDYGFLHRTPYFATERGFFYLDVSRVEARFEPVSGIYANSSSLTIYQGMVYVATGAGVYRVEGDSSRLLFPGAATEVWASRIFPGRIYVATFNGLAYFEHRHPREKATLQLKYVPNAGYRILHFVEDWFGQIWAETDRGIIRLGMGRPGQPARALVVQGLPASGSIRMVEAFGEIVFCTTQGLFMFNRKLRKCVPFTVLGESWGGKPIANVFEDPYTRAVLVSTKEGLWYGLPNPTADTAQRRREPYLWQLHTFKTYPSLKANLIIPYQKNEYWIGSEFGLLRFAPQGFKVRTEAPSVQLRRVVLNGDSSLFGGYWLNRTARPNPADRLDSLQLARLTQYTGYGSLRLELSSACYTNEDAIEYRWWVEGAAKTWSAWTTQTDFELANLPAGHYRIHLQARLNAEHGPELVVPFVVKPQWYETRQARVLFVLGAILTLILIFIIVVQANANALKRRNEELRILVDERTRELREQNDRIEKANAEILRVNDEITNANSLLTTANEAILEKNREIAQKNEDITASIQYAKRIQSAILPKPENLQEAFADQFIFFRPRDIVSGDFYWFAKASDTRYVLAVGDCTGHGVPGALMSMIGSSALNKIVKEQAVTEPHLILGHLHQAVHVSLQQNLESTYLRDGMDIAILTLDTASQTLELASAQRPVYLFLSGEFEQLEPDKQPIGGPAPEKTFTLHRYTYRTGDRVYLFSDGYPDQFGGDLGRKFQTRRLRELIQSLQPQPLAEHGPQLQATYDTWKGSHEQVDDVLVVGVELP
jgi:serine phosphatase RsbU (regulator of sigma subunit)/ligand-binding sensor domain-containing protein